MNTSPAARIQSNLNELFQANVSSGMPYIKFQLDSKTEALLSMERVEESHVINIDKITPLPAMPNCVIGMMNSRDHVFCVVDLAQLLEIPIISQTPQDHQILVVNTSELNTDDANKIFLGFSVHQVQGIIRISGDHIYQPSGIPDYLEAYVSSYVLDGQKKVVILDTYLILSRVKALDTHQSF